MVLIAVFFVEEIPLSKKFLIIFNVILMQIVSVYFFVIETCNMIQHYILIDLLDFKRKKIRNPK